MKLPHTVYVKALKFHIPPPGRLPKPPSCLAVFWLWWVRHSACRLVHFNRSPPSAIGTT